jgi:uncharacterized membrane protein YhaH (DUF805 family)
MKGNVIGFDPDTNTGAISGHDGKRYEFATIDWHSHEQKPAHGVVVDFKPEGERATEIYILEPQYVPPSFGAFYFSPRGRISRSQYWLRFFLPVFVIGLILSAVASASGDPGVRILPSVFQLIVVWPGIAVLIKRIHDRNKSGALVWALYGPMIPAIILTIAAVAAVPSEDRQTGSGLFMAAGVFGIAALGVGVWFFIEFGCMRGTVGSNQYGPDPVRHP